MKNFLNFTVIKVFLLFEFITRLCLSIYGLIHNQLFALDLPSIFFIGIVNDLITITYFFPILLIIITIFQILLKKVPRIYNFLAVPFYFLFIFILVFTLVARIIFWDEFGTNFNFIAVDYLIYTDEIIGTIQESLPLNQIIFGLVFTSLLITFFSRRLVINKLHTINLKSNCIYILCLALLNVTISMFYDSDKLTLSHNIYAIELAKNGEYEFVSAFIKNSLDYNQYYHTIDKAEALGVVRSHVLQPNQSFLSADNILRNTEPNKQNAQGYSKPNVVFIVVESLSAEFMGKFGNKHNITPNLDKLASESIFFTNIYASGTRTVRGLEAISLSVPPTPGSSIIRRPRHQNLFNISTIFKANGYDVNFIFGGYSYFDNLQNFFSSNGYKITDRSDLKSSEITFANIWGVADEDILLKSLEKLDNNHKQNKPTFALIMTTSNHRPFTFPENRIDLKSGSNRNAAVKYTDYAIGKFFELAKSKEWFDNTIFVITAEHCASSAGKISLPVHKYHIPLMIYAPKMLYPKEVSTLASQIDITPTILGILNFNYNSKFFGRDILNYPLDRAFISTYQLLGYIKNEHLIILAPNTASRTYKLSQNNQIEVQNIDALVQEAISFYQTAYDLYTQGQMVEYAE